MSDPTRHLEADEREDDALRAAVTEALADDAAGRTIPYEDARRWLLSWGTAEESPPPPCG